MAIATKVAAIVIVLAVAFVPRGAHPAPPLSAVEMPSCPVARDIQSQAALRTLATGLTHSS